MQEVIRVKSRMACPVRQKNGSWKVIEKRFIENVPDLGREYLICNSCGFSAYPACLEWCKVTRKKTRLEAIEESKKLG